MSEAFEKAPDQQGESAEEQARPLGRVARKRQEARVRLINAAARLFREQGVEAVTIGAITRAADVGHGSFYLHFKSKHEILLPIMMEDAAALDAKVQRALGAEADPAVILATSARYVGISMVRDPLWQWFLAEAGVPVETVRQAIGAFGTRDFKAGLARGRFQVGDLEATAVFLFGGYVSVLLAGIKAEDPERLINQAAAIMLRTLGLEREEAAEIAARPLEDIL
ncbi:MAG: TetR/AcrR family transcriptional regulator [Pseudomonadota bacterium]